MKKNPHIEKIKSCSAWSPEEVLLLLTGRTYQQIDRLRTTQKPSDPNSLEEIKDQYNLFKKITRATKDRDIDSPSPVDTALTFQWRLMRPSVLLWIESNKETIFPWRHFPDDTEDVLMDMLRGREEERATKPQKAGDKLAEQKKNKGGRPGADPNRVITAKITELKLEKVKNEDIPWDIRFTKFVQKLKKRKINSEYSNKKIHPRIKGKEYTKRVGISLDTVKKLIEEPPT